MAVHPFHRQPLPAEAGDWWYDGRRDIVAATGAALDYLTYLHDLLDDDWLNAIAAYNCGEANVQRAIRKNKAAGKRVDFWNLKLPGGNTQLRAAAARYHAHRRASG